MPKEGKEGEYNKLTVKAELIIPDAWNMRERFNKLNDEKEYELWQVLSSPRKNRKLDLFSILNFGSDIRCGEADEEKMLVETLYGTDENGEKLTLNMLRDKYVVAWQDIEKIKKLRLTIVMDYYRS